MLTVRVRNVNSPSILILNFSTNTRRYVSNRLENNRAVTDKLRVCVNQKVYSFLLKNQLSFTDRGILYAGHTLANHLEEIPHKTWKENKTLLA